MSSQAGPVAAGLADREGARLVARPDVVSQRRPGQGRRSHFQGIASAGFRLLFWAGTFLHVHLGGFVTLQSGETLHMGVNATRFACRQLGRAYRTGRPPGMLAAALFLHPGSCHTGPETPHGSSVLTVREQQR